MAPFMEERGLGFMSRKAQTFDLWDDASHRSFGQQFRFLPVFPPGEHQCVICIAHGTATGGRRVHNTWSYVRFHNSGSNTDPCRPHSTLSFAAGPRFECRRQGFCPGSSHFLPSAGRGGPGDTGVVPPTPASRAGCWRFTLFPEEGQFGLLPNWGGGETFLLEQVLQRLGQVLRWELERPGISSGPGALFLAPKILCPVDVLVMDVH